MVSNWLTNLGSDPELGNLVTESDPHWFFVAQVKDPGFFIDADPGYIKYSRYRLKQNFANLFLNFNFFQFFSLKIPIAEYEFKSCLNILIHYPVY